MSHDPQRDSDTELVRAGADLERAREKVVLSLGAVRLEIRHALDWRDWVRRRPRMALALAVALGVFLGRRGMKRPIDH